MNPPFVSTSSYRDLTVIAKFRQDPKNAKKITEKFRQILKISKILKNLRNFKKIPEIGKTSWFYPLTFFKTVKKFIVSGIDHCSWHPCSVGIVWRELIIAVIRFLAKSNNLYFEYAALIRNQKDGLKPHKHPSWTTFTLESRQITKTRANNHE